MINRVILLGNLGKDPEIRTLESGAKVASFPLATNENYKDRDGQWQTVTEWHNVKAWRGLADRADQSLKKGSLLYVEGKITTRKYTDSNNQERYITEVVANYFRVINKGESGPKIDANQSATEFSSSVESEFDTSGNTEDDLPF
jgi:single-strand DNA-binding protein